jgi:16S rRNA processing protein RimM
MTRRILLGHIVSAHGIKGEVLVKSYTGSPQDIAAYGPLADEQGRDELTIEHARTSNKGVIARISGVRDRTSAEALRGRALTVPREALPPAADGDYYHEDLVGLIAVTDDGTPFARVVAVQNFGAGDLLEILSEGMRETELIPFTDACVPLVDIAAGRITIRRPILVDDGADDDSGDDTEGETAT